MRIFKLFKKSKTNFSLAENVGETVLTWILTRKYRLVFFGIVVSLLVAVSHAPYINLLFDSYLIILISTILSPFILNIGARPFFIVSLVLFAVTVIVWFVNWEEAEIITDYIFIILLSGILRELFS